MLKMSKTIALAIPSAAAGGVEWVMLLVTYKSWSGTGND